MKYQPPYDPALGGTPVDGVHNTDPDASYVNGNPATGNEGSIPPAEAFEHPQREILKVITEAGIDPDEDNLEQLWEALKWLAGERLLKSIGEGGIDVYTGISNDDVHEIRSLEAGAGIALTLVEDPPASGRHRIRIDNTGDGAGGGSGVAITITPESLSTLIKDVPFSETLTASGGTGPYTWSLQSGTLPAGLTLNASTGVISGTPAAGGAYAFVAKATDSGGNYGTKAYAGTVLSFEAPNRVVFSYTGADQNWQIPANVTALKVKAWGSDGGGGGGGGFAEAIFKLSDLSLSPLDVLRIMVGGATRGYTGVGGGTFDVANCPYGFGGEGSGRSDANGTQCGSGGGLAGLFKGSGAIEMADVIGSNAMLIAPGGGGDAYHNLSTALGQGGGKAGSGGAADGAGEGNDGATTGTAHGGGGAGRSGGELDYLQAGNGTYSGEGGTAYADPSAISANFAAGEDGSRIVAGAAGNQSDPDNGGSGTYHANGRLVIYWA